MPGPVGIETDFTNTWRDCTSLTSFPLIDTSAVTNFTNVWRNCSTATEPTPTKLAKAFRDAADALKAI